MKRIHEEISLLLVAAIAFWGFPASADEVSVPDALPAIEPTGPTPSDISTAVASDPIQTAMLYHVPSDTNADIVPAPSSPLPLVASAATAADTRIGVDLSSANAASAGWPWYGKAALIAGCVLVAGVAAWAIVEACESGNNTSGDDSSHHTTITMRDGNSVTVHYGSTETSGPGPGGPR